MFPARIILVGFVPLLYYTTVHDEVFLAVYEKSKREPSMTQTLWAFRSRITLENLNRSFNPLPNAKALHPLLHMFLHEVNYPCHTVVTYIYSGLTAFRSGFMLQHHHRLNWHWGILSVLLQEPLLRALQYLPDIIKLQRVLTTHFNLKIDRNECQTKVFIRSALAQVTVSSGKMRLSQHTNECMHS